MSNDHKSCCAPNMSQNEKQKPSPQKDHDVNLRRCWIRHVGQHQAGVCLLHYAAVNNNYL